MAIHTFYNGYCLINAVALSDHVKSMKLDYNAPAQDASAMGNSSKVVIAGIKEWSLTVEFYQDRAAASVDATLFALVGVAAFAVEVRETTGARSATNPAYNGNAILSSYSPLGGAHGSVETTQAVFTGAGDLSRSVS